MDSGTLLLLAQESVATCQWVPQGGQLVNSTTPATVFAWGVAPSQAYQFRGSVFYTTPASAGKPALQLATAGSAAVSWTGYNFTYAGGAANTYQTVCYTAFSNLFNGPTFTASDTYVMTVEGIAVFSTGAAGGMLLQAACTVAADTWTIQQGSYMTVEPV